MSGALGESAPALAKGADDIYWVHQLHEALTAHGYYPDDDEAADWFYGDHTASAVTAFQACTLWLHDARCVCCLRLHRLSCVPLSNAATEQLLAAFACSRPAGGCLRQASATRRPGRHCWATGWRGRSSRRPDRCAVLRQAWLKACEQGRLFLATSTCGTGLGTGPEVRCFCRHSRRRLQQAQLRTLQPPQRLPLLRRTPRGQVPSGRRAERQRSGPSCVREMVGARCALLAPHTVGYFPPAAACCDQLSAALRQVVSRPLTRLLSQVHSLHVALSRQGFSCHEEELEWWQFGDTTFGALITFQACGTSLCVVGCAQRMHARRTARSLV